ncbi:hypothetical protein FH972_021865 [Carpinus fangiana]|uniref:Ribosomal protein eL8/eL30/eS12/Gadd45 domain-containing protein n=1 Tax=Carpinus fangiana TaxID=176857 RepID=A0A5N6KQK5_9ROSI|nr:hypothetical protein FH972_021865 [Carpinus fangiana]
MADDKVEKKVMKGVKRSAKNKAIRRGVKEVVKAIRKSETKGKALGLVVLAADISPWDVLSHIPVLCEDKDIKYVWVPSRAELGAAGSTKRPTSVVMICPKGTGKADKEKDAEWTEQYEELWKVVSKASKAVKI